MAKYPYERKYVDPAKNSIALFISPTLVVRREVDFIERKLERLLAERMDDPSKTRIVVPRYPRNVTQTTKNWVLRHGFNRKIVGLPPEHEDMVEEIKSSFVAGLCLWSARRAIFFWDNENADHVVHALETAWRMGPIIESRIYFRNRDSKGPLFIHIDPAKILAQRNK